MKLNQLISIPKITYLVLSAISLNLNKTYGQYSDTDLKINVCISDTSGECIKAAAIFIYTLPDNQLVAYENLGDTCCRKITIPKSVKTTFQVKVSASGYEPNFKSIIADSLNYYLVNTIYITLKTQISSLPNVWVIPPVWVRGDTTFYNADAFKTGGERKLKDLVEKMPGFERNQDGVLLFNKKPIEKITIEGEEIFADKIELLLNSFPIHVLEQVQALENQNDNALLKGLKHESRVFINLALKKKGMKAAFGDGEIAIGTSYRFAINPVIFGLYNKIKAGYIGNINTLGNSFSGRIKYELLNNAQIESNNWMIANTIPMPDDVDTKRYVQNRLIDNRLQLNLPLNKKLLLKTDITAIFDRQKQLTNHQRFFVNQDSIFSFMDYNKFIVNPNTFYTTSKLEFKIKSSEKVRLEIQLFGDLSRMNKSTNIQYLDTSDDNLFEKIRNNGLGGILKGDYTSRISERKAILVNWYLHHYHINQKGSLENDRISDLYNIDSNYNQINQKPLLNHTKASLQKEWLIRKNKSLRRYGIISTIENGQYRSLMAFSSKSEAFPDTKFDPLVYNFQQLNLRLATYSQFNKSLKNTSFKGLIKAGTILQPLQSNKNEDTRIQPWLEGEGKVLIKHSKRVESELTLKQEIDTRPIQNWLPEILPYGIQSFIQYRNPSLNINKTQIDGSIKFKSGKWLRTLLGTFIQNWNGQSNFSEIERYISIQVRSFIQNPTKQYRIAFHNTYTSIYNHLALRIFIGYHNNQIWYNLQNNHFSGNNHFIYANASISKSIPNKYTFDFESQLTGNKNRLPAAFKANFERMTYQLQFRTKFGLNIKKEWSLQSSHEFFANNLNTPNAAAFYIQDLQISYTPLKGNFSYRFAVDNITNSTSYYYQTLSPVLQSFYNFPLIPRNFMFYMRYTF